MRILVYNIPNTLNYGSMMMAENFIYYYNQNRDKNAEFVIITPNPEETKRRFEEELDNDIKIETIKHSDIMGSGFFCKVFNLLFGTNLKKIIKNYKIDKIVALGGDDFSEDYGILGPILELIEFYHYNRFGLKVYLCGQTIGPFKSWRIPIYKFLLSKTFISARDPITYEYLTKELNIKNVELSADLAFLPLKKEKYELNIKLPEKYITIVSSGIIWKYSIKKDRQKYIETLTKIIICAMNFYNSDIVLLPHVLYPENADDRLYCKDLYISLLRNNVPKDKIHLFLEELLPYQARKILGKGEITITGRMHAAISSLEQGVPAVSLSYSQKYHGIIGKYFDLEELIVDVRFKRWDEIFDECVNKLRILRFQDNLNKKIIENMKRMQEIAIRAIK